MKTVGTPAARVTVAFALALWIALSQIPHPRPIPLPADASVSEFSAARAIEQIVGGPLAAFPAGSLSPENTSGAHPK